MNYGNVSKATGQKFQNLGFPGYRYILTLILFVISNGEVFHLYYEVLYLSSTFSSYVLKNNQSSVWKGALCKLYLWKGET